MQKLLDFTYTANVLLLWCIPLKFIPLFVPGFEAIHIGVSAVKLSTLLIFFVLFLRAMDRKARLRRYVIAGLAGSVLLIGNLIFEFLIQYTQNYELFAYVSIPVFAGWILLIAFFWQFGSSVPAGSLRRCSRITAVLPVLIGIGSNLLPALILSAIEIDPKDYTVVFAWSGTFFSVLNIGIFAWFFHTFHTQLK